MSSQAKEKEAKEEQAAASISKDLKAIRDAEVTTDAEQVRENYHE